MKFRTTCSHCQSVFRLSAEQLEAAQGWAQCSVCGAPFNARSTLAAENGDPLPSEMQQPISSILPDPISVGAVTAETVRENPPLATPQTPINVDPATFPGVSPLPQLAGIENRAGGPDLTSIILIDPDAEATEDYGPLPHFSTLNPTDSKSATTSGSVYRPAYAATPVATHKIVKQTLPVTPPVPQKTVTRVTPPRSGTAQVIWGLISLILLLALLLQLVYFFRDVVALKIPTTRPWLELGCAKIGCTLGLPKDAALIQIIGSDLQAEPAGPGHLQLKLTLGNRAPYAQAWPVLVLTLTDRKDQPQARRSFAPSEYLSDQKLLALGIPAQSEHQLSLPLEVRDMPLAGYRLEVAY